MQLGRGVPHRGSLRQSRHRSTVRNMEATVAELADDLVGPDTVLLLLAAPSKSNIEPNRINGITRLEKLLFLAEKEEQLSGAVKSDAFEFMPYHYGPYSRAIYEAVELLEEAGLLQELRSIDESALDDAEQVYSDATEEGAVERQFRLTSDGVAVAQLLGARHPNTTQALTRIKDRYGDLSLRRLIRYVYSTYPDYAKESRIRDQFT